MQLTATGLCRHDGSGRPSTSKFSCWGGTTPGSLRLGGVTRSAAVPRPTQTATAWAQPGSRHPSSPLQAHSPKGHPNSLQPPRQDCTPNPVLQLLSCSHPAAQEGQNWGKGKQKMAGQGPGHLVHCPSQMGEQNLCIGTKADLREEKKQCISLLSHAWDRYGKSRQAHRLEGDTQNLMPTEGLNSVKNITRVWLDWTSQRVFYHPSQYMHANQNQQEHSFYALTLRSPEPVTQGSTTMVPPQLCRCHLPAGSSQAGHCRHPRVAFWSRVGSWGVSFLWLTNCIDFTFFFFFPSSIVME